MSNTLEDFVRRKFEATARGTHAADSFIAKTLGHKAPIYSWEKWLEKQLNGEAD